MQERSKQEDPFEEEKEGAGSEKEERERAASLLQEQPGRQDANLEDASFLQPHKEQKQQPGLRKLALAVSVVFHPLVVPSMLFALIFFFAPQVTAPLPEEYRLSMLGLLVLTTFLIPLGSLLILFSIGSIPSLQMPDRKERSVPFLFVSVFYAVTSYIFISKYPHLVNINVLLAGISFIIFLITAITFYWKISAHSTAVSGAVGFLLSFVVLYRDSALLYALVAMIVLAGAVMSARLYLNEHEPAEVWIGSLLGLLISISSVFFFLLL